VKILGRLALAAAAIFAGCASNRPRGPASTTAAVLRAGPQCGGDVSGPAAHWISTEGELRAAMGAGGAFGTEPASVDFRKEGVLAVYMGQRPTGGYALALHDPAVPIAGGVGTVTVRFDEPPPGAMVTQVLTSPCLLLRIPKEGIRQLRVVDPAGTVRVTVGVTLQRPEQPPGTRRY
jgi:protease stability complex PrcB-like protein